MTLRVFRLRVRLLPGSDGFRPPEMVMSRRVITLCLFSWLSAGACLGQESRLAGLPLLGSDRPQSFFFRHTEGMARRQSLPFDAWEKTFARLNGIMGKALDEEVPNTSAGCLLYFTRFKKLHPRQAVLLHYNGNSRDPRFDADAFFAGHWIYYNGCRLSRALPAEEAESTVYVDDVTLFRTNMGLYGTSNDDIGLCAIGPDGRPDWNVCEQVQLLDIDAANSALRIKRGCFGTKPLSWPAGTTHIAAHVTEGPWGKKSNLLWYYNFSAACPKDSQGRRCSDVLVDDLAKRFRPAGQLGSFDGLEFDVLSFGHMTPPPAPRGWDVDADGKADWGIVGGINIYGIGVYEFCRQLRRSLGEDTIIMADGGTPNAQRSFGLLNGIESEGWPHLADHTVDDWSGGLNRHFYWRDHARKPVLNYVNHKFVEPIPGKQGEHRNAETPLGRSRLIFAACMFTDSAITYSLPCTPAAGESFGVYDELRKGTENRINWLGRPLGPPIRLALATPDLLQGRAVKPEWTPAGGTSSFLLRDLAIPEGDLFVHCTIKADPMAGYPPDIPRLLWVEARRDGDLMTKRPLVSGMVLRGGQETAIKPESGGMVRDLAPFTIGGETHTGYYIHPPWREGQKGYVFWQTETRVPAQAPQLRFLTGLSDRPPSKSDGITFKVLVLDGASFREIFSYHHAERVWKKHIVDVSPWQGQRMTFRFVADCGPQDNTVADQGCWAEAAILGAGEAHRQILPMRYMAWAGKDDADVGFYYRDLGPCAVELRFEIEGSEPVRVSRLTLHSQADAVVRLFEHGAALANPSNHDYVFKLKSLFPDRSFRRLQASPEQDPATNNGRAVGDEVKVGAREGLLLVARQKDSRP